MPLAELFFFSSLAVLKSIELSLSQAYWAGFDKHTSIIVNNYKFTHELLFIINDA